MNTHTKNDRKRRRAHRAGYPTPGFYLFSLLLNVTALGLLAWVLKDNTQSILIWSLWGVALLGTIASIISALIKPKESNIKARKLLVGLTVVYGFAISAAAAVCMLMWPTTFI